MGNETEGREGRGKREEKGGKSGMRRKKEWTGRRKGEEKGEKKKKMRMS